MQISDFKIPVSTLRTACRLQGVPFVDLDVKFEGDEGLRDSAICIGDTSSLGQTLYKIAEIYIYNSEKIIGKPIFNSNDQRDDFLIYYATLLRNILRDDSTFPITYDELHVQRLYQRTLVWILMKDLICPLHGKVLQNFLLVCNKTPFVDVARFYKKDEISDDNAPQEDFLFFNSDVGNSAVMNAHLLLCAIEAHGLDATTVMRELFESDLYAKLEGAARLAFSNEEQVDEFVAVIFHILQLDVESYPHMAKDAQAGGMKKHSQGGDGAQQVMPMQWWYLGLTEKMLEPVRGYDWSTRQALQVYVEDFWNKVEDIKSKHKPGEGVPFDSLLRLKAIQTVDNKIDTRTTLQEMLSSQRVWN